MARHNLYMFRCDRKLTKGDMAKKTGVSRTTYTHIEKGERFGSEKFWNNFQGEFNVPDNEMFLLMKNEEREELCEGTNEKSQ